MIKRKQYGVKDILDNFLYACYAHNIPLYETRDIIHSIIYEDYSLFREETDGARGKNRRYICEWNEDGLRERDEWVIDPEKFVSGIANEYFRDLIKNSKQ